MAFYFRTIRIIFEKESLKKNDKISMAFIEQVQLRQVD